MIVTAIGGDHELLCWLDEPTDDEWEVLAALTTRHIREGLPDERSMTGAALRSVFGANPGHRRLSTVLATQGREPVGLANLIVDELRKEAAALPLLFVTPEHRRRGVGRRLLEAVRENAKAAGRARLRTTTLVGDRASTAFAEGAGGRPGLVNEHSRCLTAALDPGLLRTWVEQARERARDYSLVAFDGVCPDEHLEAFAAATLIMNTAPRAEGTEETVPTPEQVRDSMLAHSSQGNESWTVCARDDGTGQFVGYTELGIPKHRPWLSWQGDTGVHPDHRQRGLGRWLKAVNALRLLAERPEVEHIDTYNAQQNAAMLSINRAMGFRPIARWQEWDVPV